jgi:hypothetical protein
MIIAIMVVVTKVMMIKLGGLNFNLLSQDVTDDNNENYITIALAIDYLSRFTYISYS